MYLKLFGNPVVTDGPEEFPFSAERRYQLLAYLACRDDWVPRDELTALFWPGHTNEAARRNLRKLLHDVRQVPWLAGLAAQGDSLRWQVQSDIADFRLAWSRTQWSACMALYSGTVLEGLERNSPEPFHEWLRYERELQLNRLRECVATRRIEIFENPRARAELAVFALTHDPYSEAAAGDLVEALQAMGRGGEALSVYRAFTDRLKNDLGVEPTQKLRTVLSAQESCASSPDTLRGGPAIPDNAFIGRRLEQAGLVSLLARSECRALTIHGPGGVGKSSFARSSLGALTKEFPEGLSWVGLEDLSSVAQIPGRIAESCGFKLDAQQDPLDCIAARIGASRMLLVFDNCEHLPEIRALGAFLMERCGGLKILHTSRTRIGIPGERVFPLEGLPVPDPDESEMDVLRNFDSIRLFEARARETEPRFELAGSIDSVVVLVRLVEGLPLALELAAACVRLIPVGEIVRDLTRLLDLQDLRHTEAESGSAHGRGLRASFDHSWQMLSPAERFMLSQLSVFGGSFSVAAAHHVAGAELVMIGSLADKSLVRCSGDGRFSLHPLIRQFAREHLQGPALARYAHAAYFAQLMLARTGVAGAAPVPWDSDDVSSCIDAWYWVTSQSLMPLLQQMAIPLLKVLNGQYRWQEGLLAFGAALESLEDSDRRADYLRATLQYGMARYYRYAGELDAAERMARASLRTCRSLHVPCVTSGNLHTIGYALIWRGEAAHAKPFLEQSVKRALLERDEEGAARARYALAFREQVLGNWAVARTLHEQNEAYCRATGMHQLLAMTLYSLGGICLAEENWVEAKRLLDDGIRVCAERNLHGTSCFLFANHGLALIGMRDLKRAAESVGRALSIAQQWNMRIGRADAHLAHCCLALEHRDPGLALRHLQQAMTFAKQTQSPVRLLSVCRYWGEWLARQGDSARGAAVLQFVRAGAGTLAKDRQLAAAVLASLPRTAGNSGARGGNAAMLSLSEIEKDVLEARI